MRYGRAMAAAVAAVTMAGMAMPAQAQRWGGGRHHRSHDRISAGDALLGVLLVGGLVAAASHDRRERERAAEPVYDNPPPPVASEPYQPAETPAPDSARFDGLYDEEAASDRCASEAEMAGTHYARLARVTGVTDTVWNGSSWLVRGRMEFADSYRDSARTAHGFNCKLKRGARPVVSIEGV